MRLIFGGYGGEYCCGKLTDIEIKNIRELLKRFDKYVIIGNYDTCFDTHGFKEVFYDFDDIEHILSCNIEGTIWIEEIGDYKLDEDYFSTNDCEVNIDDTDMLKDGWYISSILTEKGSFFHTDLDISPDNFDKSKLRLECKDLDEIGLANVVIQSVYYDNEELEMNYDSCSTTGKGFEQDIFLVKDGRMLDGVELLMEDSDEDESYTILDDTPGMDYTECIRDYLAFVEAQREGFLLKSDKIIIFVSPFLYEHFPKKDVDELWLTEKNIKYAIKNNLKTEIPDDIWERAINRYPEWFI